MNNDFELATFGGGCFWCLEAVFLRVKGVKSVVSGYSGGLSINPTYKEVCSGTSGHAEVVQITYDPNEINFTDLLHIFFEMHDPTTLNRQGADVGTQYRSVIYYHSLVQKEIALNYIQKLESDKIYANNIVTELSELGNFFAAEKYHENYYALNPNQGYCKYVILPKVQKLDKNFKNLQK